MINGVNSNLAIDISPIIHDSALCTALDSENENNNITADEKNIFKLTPKRISLESESSNRFAAIIVTAAEKEAPVKAKSGIDEEGIANIIANAAANEAPPETPVV